MRLTVFVLFGDCLLVWICYLGFGFVVVLVACVFKVLRSTCYDCLIG